MKLRNILGIAGLAVAAFSSALVLYNEFDNLDIHRYNATNLHQQNDDGIGENGIENEISESETDEREGLRQRLFGITNFEGSQLFDSSWMIEDILNDNRVEDAIALANIGFDENQIHAYLSSDYDVNLAVGMSQIKDNDENRIFLPHIIFMYADEVDINFVEFTRELVALEDEGGRTIFSMTDVKRTSAYINDNGEKVSLDLPPITPSMIRQLYQSAREHEMEPANLISLIRTLTSFRDNENQVIYDSPRSITNFIRDNLTEAVRLSELADLIRQYTSLITRDGKTIFSNEWEINEILKLEADFETIRSLADLTNPNGESVFTEGFVIRHFLEDNGTVEYAQQLADAGYSGRQIVALNGLGLTVEETLHPRDSELPNFLLSLPHYDDNFSFYRNAEEWREILPSYDTFVIFADDETDIYHAIEAIPDIELLSLEGHGTKTSIFLSYDEAIGEEDREEFVIDMNDTELERYLDMLSPNAVISIDSCDTALGGRDHYNLFRVIVNMAHGRTVIGADGKIYPLSTELLSEYPLNRRYHDFHGNDITVRSND